MATLFSGFDNPFSTAKIAADLSQSEYERGRQADAYNALREMYGAQVGNLDWRQAQATDAATQKLPGELEQQQLANQGTRQTNAFNEMMNPMKLEEKRMGIAQDRQMNPLRVQAQQNTNTLNQQKIGSGEQEAADATAERNRNFVLGLTAAAKQRLAAGESPASVWAGLAPHLASMEGADPDKVKAIGEHFLANPSQFIESSEAAANATRPNTAYMRAQADQARAAAAKQKADLQAQKQNPAPTESGMVALQNQGELMERAFDSALGDEKRPGTVDRITKSPLTRYALEWSADRNKEGITPSGVENAFRADRNTIISNLGLDAFQKSKAAGVTFGALSDNEHRLLQSSATRLKGMTDPREIKAELAYMRDHYRKFHAAQMADARKRAAGIDPATGKPLIGGGGTAAPQADAPTAPQQTLSEEGDAALADFYRRR